MRTHTTPAPSRCLSPHFSRCLSKDVPTFRPPRSSAAWHEIIPKRNGFSDENHRTTIHQSHANNNKPNRGTSYIGAKKSLTWPLREVFAYRFKVQAFLFTATPIKSLHPSTKAGSFSLASQRSLHFCLPRRRRNPLMSYCLL